jgi:hypothetical protein
VSDVISRYMTKYGVGFPEAVQALGARKTDEIFRRALIRPYRDRKEIYHSMIADGFDTTTGTVRRFVALARQWKAVYDRGSPR